VPIVIDRLSKRFGRQAVLDRVSLEVNDGELFVLLGASGSGKSTVLRLIAGLLPADEGRIVLHDKDVTDLPPQQRGTGFVFQNYSIFRHMSVADNIEFGLKIRRVTAEQRAKKRDELLDLVGLMGLGGRYADQLSGGQLQRVALARALAYEPSVLLLDEPFGALDVRIRGQLRRSLKEIQRRLNVATILVTHDQEEAFELGDRIGVLERGRLLEVGEPESLYARPKSLYVASFLGGGTVLAARAEAGRLRFGDLSFPIPEEVPHQEGDWVTILTRPEQVRLTAQKPASGGVGGADAEGGAVLGAGSVAEQNFSGTHRRVRVRLERLPGVRQLAPTPPFGEEGLLVDALLPSETPLNGDQLWVGLRGWHVLAPPPSRMLVHVTDAADAGGDRGVGGGALAMARSLAGQIGSSVTLLATPERAEEAETLRVALEKRRAEPGMERVEVKVRAGDALRQIALEQQEHFYELLVLAVGDGAPPSGGLSHRVSRLAMRLLEQPPTPVLLVNGGAAPDAFERILICTRAGEPGKSDVRVGGWLARRLGAAVTLLYVTREGEEPSELVRGHLGHAAATLRGLDVPAEVRFRPAPSPVEGIVEEARSGDFAITVLGSHGPQSRSALARDDVTLQVVTRAPTAVLVVPAEE